MSGHIPKRSQRGQRGVGIIELMITMVIGLIMVIALSYFFIGGRMLNRSSDDVSRMQESGRNALEIMGRAIRQAGYRKNVGVVFGGVAVNGTQGAGAAPDSITVQYDAQTDGSDIDCTGNSVASGTLTAFFAVNNGVNPPVLTCNGTVVVENIENMKIQYGLDTDKNGNLENYIPTSTQFGQVAAVQISLLVRGPTANAATNRTQNILFNGSNVANDGYLRQVFGATFTVRNQAW